MAVIRPAKFEDNMHHSRMIANKSNAEKAFRIIFSTNLASTLAFIFSDLKFLLTV